MKFESFKPTHEQYLTLLVSNVLPENISIIAYKYVWKLLKTYLLKHY